ncbi:MAG TPA: cytochrome P450 [Acidimicrobiia bacterium]|jgi:cytochrome P450|nr:cytochrome P450 [Acidimicrobiia bacterium]HIL05733.1 cytochrome P450 [Acidimicrobiia bacterium]
MSSAPTVNIDPAAFWANPYPTLTQMRQSAPICFVPELGATLITRRDDIHTCEKNVAVFSSDQPDGLMNVLMGRNMMRKDADEHRQERFIYYPAISPRKVEQVWATLFEDLTDTVLASFQQSGSADLVPHYATAVSGEALKAITGLTQVWFQDLDAWSQAMIDGVANYTNDPEAESRCHAATAAIDAAISERLPQVKKVPDYSLLSVMTEAGMPEEMVRANIKLTISGGQNEPRDAIAGAIWALLTHPDQLALAVSGEVSWLQVFEEYCRWIAPIGMSPRRVAIEHSYDGVTFEPEDRVFFMFNSANRDENHFDAPDVFDVTRDTTASLTFGAGPHFCAGAAASRSLVGNVALPKLFERLGELRLDALAPPVEFGGWAFRGPLTLPAIWGQS